LNGLSPDALLLDAGGVLVLPRLELVGEVLGGVVPRVDAPSVDAAHYAGVRAIDQTDVPLADRSRVYRAAFVAELGLEGPLDPVVDQRLATAFREGPMWERPVVGAAALIRACQGAGLPVVIVSNWDGTIHTRLRSAGVCQAGPGRLGRVERVVDSGEVGIEKPDPRIFGIALAAVGVEPGRAIHVGDSTRADVDGARNAGVIPFHLEPMGRCRDGTHEHVSSLGTLAGLLGLGRLDT
jgi:putative hydrolase of the HAD superfamily